MNEHFATIGKRTQKKIEKSNIDPMSYMKQCDKMLNDVTVSDMDVEKIICSMKGKSSRGHDGISNAMLKEIYTTIRVPFMYVIRTSLSDGVFPEKMKLAEITPLFKNGNRDLCDNYRPISLLPVLSKVLEKIVFNRTVKHLEAIDAVSLLTGDILQLMNSGLSVMAIFIDLRKAFDTVSHSLIIDKLRFLGINDVMLSWYVSYLNNRRQLTKINNVLSSEQLLPVGVPQGSLLGVLLFQIIIDDMRKSVTFSNVILYADDTTLLVSGRNVHFIKKKLQSDLNNLIIWLNANKLCLNESKTKAMLFSEKIHLDSLELYANGIQIEFVQSFKFLGVILDEKLLFHHHAHHLYTKLLQTCYLLSKLKRLVPNKEMVMLYYAHFHSKLTYGLQVWGNLISAACRIKLFKLQKKCIRVISGVPLNAHTDPLFKKHQIIKLTELIDISMISVAHKVVYKDCPGPLIHLFNVNKSCDIRTRNCNLIIPKNYTARCNRSFLVQSIVLWNQLSPNLKVIGNHKLFVKSLKKKYLT